MARRCKASEAMRDAVRPLARKSWEAATPVARANRRRASESLDDIPHRLQLPSYPADRPHDLYGVIISEIWYYPPGAAAPSCMSFQVMPSWSALNEASMMLGDTPTVVQRRPLSSVLSIMTRVTAAVPLCGVRMRTL